MDKDDLRALMTFGASVCINVGACKSNEQGIEGSRAVAPRDLCAPVHASGMRGACRASCTRRGI
jgi:hypothetical protein